MATITVTADNFQETIDKNGIVLLDYWADWCGPCRTFGPIFEQAAEDHPEMVFGKVDTEAEQELAAAFQIRSIPTLMVFREQILVFAQAGLLPAPALEELIAKIQGLDMAKVRQQLEEEAQHPHECVGCGHDHSHDHGDERGKGHGDEHGQGHEHEHGQGHEH